MCVWWVYLLEVVRLCMIHVYMNPVKVPERGARLSPCQKERKMTDLTMKNLSMGLYGTRRSRAAK